MSSRAQGLSPAVLCPPDGRDSEPGRSTLGQWAHSASSRAAPPSTQEKLCPEGAVVPRARKREITDTMWGVAKSKKPLRAKDAGQQGAVSPGAGAQFQELQEVGKRDGRSQGHSPCGDQWSTCHPSALI